MLNKDVLEYLTDQALKAGKAEKVEIKSDPAHVHRFRKPDGTVETIESPAGPIVMKCDTIGGLLSTAAKLAVPGEGIVHYSMRGVTVYLEKSRRSMLYLSLSVSTEWKFFMSRFENMTIGPKDFVLQLLYVLRGTMTDAEGFAHRISNVTWRAGADKANVRSRGSESLDENILAECKPAEDLPDTLQVFDVRPWTNMDMPWRHPLTCIVDPDPGSQQWVVVPTVDSYANWKARCLESLRNSIKANMGELELELEEGSTL